MKSKTSNSDKLKSTLEAFCNIGFFGNKKCEISTLADEIIADSESSYFGDILNLENEALYEQILLSYDKEICWFIEDANAYFITEEVDSEMYHSVFTNLRIISKGIFTPENIEIKECGYCKGRDKRLLVNFSSNGKENELVFCTDGWSLILNFLEEINESIQQTTHSFQYIIDSYGACFVYFVSEEQKKFLIEKRVWKFINATNYWGDKASYYKEKGSLTLAENCFQKAIKGNHFKSFVDYGIFLKEQNKHGEAKAIFEKGQSILNLQKPPLDNTIWWKDFIQNQIEEINNIN